MKLNEQFFVSHHGAEIRVWNLKELCERKQRSIGTIHKNGIRTICRLNNGTFASCGKDGVIRTWLQDGEPTGTLMVAHSYSSNGIADVYGAYQNSDGTIASWGGDRTLRLWTEEGEQINIAPIEPEDLYHFSGNAFPIDDDRIALWERLSPKYGSVGTVQIYSVSRNSFVSQLRYDVVSGGCKIGADRLVFWNNSGGLIVTDSTLNVVLDMSKLHNEPILSVDVMPNGLVVSLDKQRCVKAWEITSEVDKEVSVEFEEIVDHRAEEITALSNDCFVVRSSVQLETEPEANRCLSIFNMRKGRATVLDLNQANATVHPVGKAEFLLASRNKVFLVDCVGEILGEAFVLGDLLSAFRTEGAKLLLLLDNGGLLTFCEWKPKRVEAKDSREFWTD